MKLNKRWSKLTRWAGTGALSLALLLGYVLPVHGQTSVAPAISSWSVTTLNEGEKYGIFPLAWYEDDSFQQSIPAEKFLTLMEGTAKKLDLLGLKKKNASLSTPTDKVITREAVITSLYKLLANYELPAAFEMTGDNPIDYMKKKGLVKGTSAGLELNQPSTVEQATVMASRLVEFAYDTVGGGAEGLMWKVTNGKNTMYLLGSIHMGIADMYPMQKDIREAYEASDELWVEADIINGDNDYLTQKMVYADGTTLKDHVSAETYQKVQNLLAKLQLPANSFDAYKPFAISLSVPTLGYVDSDTDVQFAMLTGIDRYFLTKAMLDEKPIKELEGIKLQADLLSDVPAEQQEKELNIILDSAMTEKGLEEGTNLLKDMQTEWVEGDLNGFTQIMTTHGDFGEGDVNQRLLGERDKNMAIKLAEVLEKKGETTSFVVVGAAHFSMKGMVIDHLKAKGYHVQQLQ
ncbi:TraB/GumN family protein [Brevibacillus sp. MER 51]|uniref:TraB/GumN family protein n=1 Tax=Brevibacillus sp. MER 51 TaxID=2939560 RepID=UPI00203D2B37|nr:TraB/GumN family protein [Brevibacillus sp. MER 51]MCM3146462.1 TraB/GumN family protein [Brevibacillus sp. MER 51]